MSASSTGSVMDPYFGEAGSRKFNPFIKAISSHRKDFSYVTQMRKEVIHIVEPFRQKVLTFDSRLMLLEKSLVELQETQRDHEAQTQHRINQMVTITRQKQYQDEILKAMHENTKKVDERITEITEKNEVMTIKLKHGEEFNKSFKMYMDASRKEREDQIVSLESYKEKMFETFLKARREMEKALNEHKLEQTKIRYSLNKQYGINMQHKDSFKLLEKIVAETVVKLKSELRDEGKILFKKVQEVKNQYSLKMFKFCMILFREFKYMNKLQEDKILFEVGYRDHLGEPMPHAKPGGLFDEVMSQSSQPSFTFLDEEKKRKRANSIHVFQPPASTKKKKKLVKKQKSEEGDPEDQLPDSQRQRPKSERAIDNQEGGSVGSGDEPSE